MLWSVVIIDMLISLNISEPGTHEQYIYFIWDPAKLNNAFPVLHAVIDVIPIGAVTLMAISPRHGEIITISRIVMTFLLCHLKTGDIDLIIRIEYQL